MKSIFNSSRKVEMDAEFSTNFHSFRAKSFIDRFEVREKARVEKRSMARR